MTNDDLAPQIEKAKQTDVLALVQQYTRLKKASRSALGGDEWAGPCPRCKGQDRFRVCTGINKWACRNCTGMEQWNDAIDFVHFLDTGQVKPANTAFVKAVQDLTSGSLPQLDIRPPAREELCEERQKLLEQFTAQELWVALHRRLENDAAARKWWSEQGIPSSMTDYWKLGWVEDKVITHEEKEYHCAAASIPYFDWQWKPATLQYRLIQPPDPKDKYRWHYGLGSRFFIAHPDDALAGEVLVTEGAKKCMLAGLRGSQKVTYLAVPSKNDFAGVEDVVKDCERVWVLLDPDGEVNAHKLAAKIGKNALVVSFHAKLDDYLVGGGAWAAVEAAQRFARPFSIPTK